MSDLYGKQEGKEFGIKLQNNKEVDLTAFQGKEDELEKTKEAYENSMINAPLQDLKGPQRFASGDFQKQNRQHLEDTWEVVDENMPPVYAASKDDAVLVQALLNSKRSLGRKDSDEMKNVKDFLRIVINAMNDSAQKTYTVDDMTRIIEKYNDAIDACYKYITHPKKDKTNKRWALVNDNMKRLQAEVFKLERAKELIGNGTWTGEAENIRQLINNVSELTPGQQISDAERKKNFEAEFAEAKKRNPKLTEADFKLFKNYQKANAMEGNQLYYKEFQKGMDVAKAAGASGTYTRDALMLIRYVNFDDDGNPASPQDQANHEWNMKWLKAWEEDDVEVRENMLEEEINGFFDNIPMPPISAADAKDLTNLGAMREKIDKWIEEISATDQLKDFYYNQKRFSVCFDQMKVAHPAIKEYLLRNPGIKAKSEALDGLHLYVNAYMMNKHQFEVGTEIKLVDYDPKDKESVKTYNKKIKDNDSNMPAVAMVIGIHLNTIEKNKNRPILPYKKPEITEEMRGRKAKRAQTLIVLEEHRKVVEKVGNDPEFKRLHQLNDYVTEEMYLVIRETESYNAVFSNAEYKELLKDAPKDQRMLNGPASAILTAVEYENGQMTEAGKRADDLNKIWLEALASGDQETIQTMVADEVRVLTDYFPKTRMASDAVFDLWQKFQDEPEKITEGIQKIRGMAQLLKVNPQATAKMEEDLKRKLDLLIAAEPYITKSMIEKYSLDLSGTKATYTKRVEGKSKAAYQKELQKLDDKYDDVYHEAEFEKRMEEAKQIADDAGQPFDEAAYRKKYDDAVVSFMAEYKALEQFMKDNKVTIDPNLARNTVISRLKSLNFEGKPVLTEREAIEMISHIDRNAPNYYRMLADKISEITNNNDLSINARTHLEAFLYMESRKAEITASRDKVRLTEERFKARKKHPVRFNVPALANVVQEKGQIYGNSCWARSGANLINTTQDILKGMDNTLEFTKVNDNFFLGNTVLDYNEEGRKHVNELYGMDENAVRDDFLDVKNDIIHYRNNPQTTAGSLYAMADFCLQATDNRAMVKSMHFELQTNDALEKIELLKDEFLKAVNEILRGGNPISVLDGGHYLTIVGIKGRNLICKDSMSHSDPNKNFDDLSVDALFEANKAHNVSAGSLGAKGGGVEIVWLEAITDESMQKVKDEFKGGAGQPGVEADYERLRVEGQVDIMPEEYAHTKGVNFRCDLTADKDPVLAGLISKSVYLPKGKPGEKVKFSKQQESEKLIEQLESVTSERKTVNPQDADFAAICNDIFAHDIKNFDMSSDAKMIESAKELEILLSELTIFNEMLDSDGKYIEALMAFGEENINKINTLSAIADYYRLRKLIVTDPTYMTTGDGFITMTESRRDTAQMKSLKKLMRACHQSKKVMNELLGLPAPKEKLPAVKGFEADMLGAFMREKYDPVAYKNTDPKALLKGTMDSISAQNSYITQIENEYHDIMKQEEENKKKAATASKKKSDFVMPAEMKDAIAKKKALEAMPRTTLKELKAYDKANIKYVTSKKTCINKYISNMAKKDKSVTPEMKQYYEDLNNLSFIRDKMLAGGYENSHIVKMHEYVEKIKNNPYHNSPQKTIPLLLENQLFDGDTAVMEDFFSQFEEDKLEFEINEQTDGFLDLQNTIFINKPHAQNDGRYIYSYYAEEGYLHSSFSDNIALSNFMKSMGMPGYMEEAKLSYGEFNGQTVFGVRNKDRYQEKQTTMEHTLEPPIFIEGEDRLIFTPEVIKKLSNLSILFAILGITTDEMPDLFIASVAENSTKVKLENGTKREIGDNMIINDLYLGRVSNSFESITAKQLAKGKDSLPAFDSINIPFLDREFVNKVLTIKPEDIFKMTGGMLDDQSANAFRERLVYIQQKLRERLEYDETLPANEKTILSDVQWSTNVDRIEQSLQGGHAQMFKEILTEHPLIEGASHKTVEEMPMQYGSQMKECEQKFFKMYNTCKYRFRALKSYEEKARFLSNLKDSIMSGMIDTNIGEDMMLRLIGEEYTPELMKAFINIKEDAREKVRLLVEKKKSTLTFDDIPKDLIKQTEKELSEKQKQDLLDEYALNLVKLDDPLVVNEAGSLATFINDLGSPTGFLNYTGNQDHWDVHEDAIKYNEEYRGEKGIPKEEHTKKSKEGETLLSYDGYYKLLDKEKMDVFMKDANDKVMESRRKIAKDLKL